MHVSQVEKEFVIVEDAHEDIAGATTWWSLSGEADRTQLEVEAKVRGIGRKPRLIEPETALGRAVATLRGKRRIIRPIRRGKWAVVEEELDITKEKLRHWEGPTVELDKVGRAVLTNATPEEAQQVRETYSRGLDILDVNDISDWLLRCVEDLGGIALRKGGGIYYVPPSGMKTWRLVIDALSVVAPACSVYCPPTVRMTKDAARALIDSLTTDIEERAESVTADVLSGDLGVRALDNRAERSRELLSKVSEYENLLGTRLERLRNVIGKLDVDVAAAKLAAEALQEDAS